MILRTSFKMLALLCNLTGLLCLPFVGASQGNILYSGGSLSSTVLSGYVSSSGTWYVGSPSSPVFPFQNGGFEATAPSFAAFTPIAPGSSTLAGWSVQGSHPVYLAAKNGSRSLQTFTSGNYSLQFSLNIQNHGCSILQQFAVTPGQAYAVTFRAANTAAVPANASLLAGVTTSDGTSLFAKLFPVLSVSSPAPCRFAFGAIGSSVTLVLQDDRQNPLPACIAVDDIDVQPLDTVLDVAASPFGLSWPSYEGVTYQLQYLTPDSEDWIDLGNPLRGTGATMHYVDLSSGSNSNRSYRVLLTF